MHKRFTLRVKKQSKNILGRRLIAAALVFSSVIFYSTVSLADETLASQETYKVAIIIDDLGNNYQPGKTLIDLPYQLTYAFLPQRPYTERLANLAASYGKEVMVHLPMQSSRLSELGEGALTLELTQKQFHHSVNASIDSVPHARGVNNHMGSLLTQHPGHMSWLMQALSSRETGLYFVDSKTTAQTVASQIAREHLIPNISRDVFLDNGRSEEEIMRQLKKLKKVAKRKGYAVAIGHPYPSTIKLLAQYLPTLLEYNIEVVPVTALIRSINQKQQWATLSPDHMQAVKQKKTIEIAVK